MAQKQEIADTSPLWWEIQNVPTEGIRELRRRSNTNNIGMNIPTPFINSTFNFEQNYKDYKGPMSPWVRVFSNGTGKSINGMVPRSAYLDKNNVEKDYNGFILKGGDGFFDAFGYEQNQPLDKKFAIIGYEADNKPHYIDTSNGNRTQQFYSTKENKQNFPQNNQTPSIIPPPGIIGVSVKQSKELLTYATFKFKCYGLAQLEYLTPFFFTAGINVFVEFGWNLFNQKSLLNLADLKECWELVYKPQTALDRANKSNGNYGCVSGIITKYSFNTTDGFIYDCSVDLISRQAMYAGMKTDNNAKISTTTPTTTTDQNDIEFLDLRTFIRTYLPSINEVMKQPQTIKTVGNNSQANFLNFILDKIEAEENSKAQKDAAANAEQVSYPPPPVLTMGYGSMSFAPPVNYNTIQSTSAAASKVTNKNKTKQNIKNNKTLFYGGKPEDRVFAGRLEAYYRAKKIPDGKSEPIKYGLVENEAPRTNFVTTKPNTVKYQQISFADEKTDFDAKDGSDEVWLQLDFVFELINLFMSNSNTKQFLVDISDVIISAHPNLISCDRHVLIPNPVSPKINKGTPWKKNSLNSGFLKGGSEEAFSTVQKNYLGKFETEIFSEILAYNSTSGNPFLNQQPDITVPIRKDLEKRYKDAVDNGTLIDFYKSLNQSDSFYFAANAAKKTFKTSGRYRDNLDTVINYLFYHSVNFKKLVTTTGKGEMASFPFAEDFTDIRKNKLGQTTKTIYSKYYFGPLKRIYISKSKLIKIAESSETKNYKQFINAILNTLNEATDNFWKFDIVEGKDAKGNSTLSIIDKNTVNYDALREVYMFELGSTNNVIKSINFDVSLTNEQAINVMFGGQNSKTLTTTITDNIKNAQTKDQFNAALNNLNITPFLKFTDRMDKFQLSLMASQQSGSVAGANSVVPGTSSGITNDNNAISDLQSYGPKEKSGVLCITTKQLRAEDEGALQYLPPVVNRATAAAAVQSGKVAAFRNIEDDVRNRKNYKFLCLPPDMKGKLTQMLDDSDFKNNVAKYSGVADNFTVTIKFDGIFSFRNLQVFAISNLPKPYVPGNVIFQILEVDHEISNGKWETTVNALVRCVGGTNLAYRIV